METYSNITIETNVKHFIVWLFLIFAILYWNKNKKTKPAEVSYKNDDDADWDTFGIVRKLTPEQVRAQPGYENLSDELVTEKIETLYKLSLIGYNVFRSGDDQCFFIE